MSSFAETLARPPTSRRAFSLDTPRAKSLALALLAVTQFVLVIDGSIVNVAFPSIGAFVAIELRQRHPLVPFAIFRLRTLRGANLVNLVMGLSLLSLFYFITLYLQDVLHYSPITTGVS